MPSRHDARPLRLMVVAVVIALLSTLFAATAAHAGTGSITGKVTKPSGSALSRSVVTLYSIANDGYIDYEKSATTRSDGTYTFGSLDRGKYIVGFGEESPTYATEFWSNRALIQNAAPISVGTSRVSSINARLDVGGKVTGRIRTEDPNDHAVADAEVIAYRYDDGEWTYGKSVLTTSDGLFTLGGLSRGQWTLEFNPPSEGPDADLALEYWENSRVFDDNDIFGVGPGTMVEDLEVHLSPGGRISGQVTGPDGEPVVDALVFGYPAENQELVGNIAFTDDNGNYTMTGLSPGQHRLEFVDALEFDPFGDGPAYASEWWDDRESFKVAERVTVEAGVTTTGKNAQLDLASTPLVNTTPPSISGTPRVGETLTADPGAWTPRISDSTFEYQWFAGGTAIDNADERTFTPNSGYADKAITVRVTADRGSGPVTATSAPTAPLAKGVLIQTGPLSLDPAEPRVGDKLDVNFADFSTPASSSVQFLADGVPFTYDSTKGVPAEALGKRLSVRQTASWPGYEPSIVTSEESAPVAVGRFDPPTTAKIAGPAIVGEPLTTSLVNAVSGATYDYQWLADGSEIPDATSATYTPRAADVGKALAVHLTMSAPGRTPAESTGAATDPVVESGVLHLTPGRIEIRGTPPYIGRDIQAVSLPWEPSGVQLTYQWLADGEPIQGATDERLTVTAAQAGKRLAIKVTGSKSGYADTSATTPETEPVTGGTPFGAPEGLEAGGDTVTTIGLRWTPVEGAAGYRISYGIGSGTRTRVDVGKVTLTTIKGLKPGTEYSIDIAALRSDGTRSAYSPRILERTPRLWSPDDFEVTKVTPSSVTLVWSKVPGVLRYRITHGIGSGTRTTTDVGDVSTKTITGLKPGTTYSFDIASLHTDGTRSSNTPRVDATTDPFLPPTNLASPGATSSTIDLTWTKSLGATKYRISYVTGSGTPTRIDVGDVSSRTLTGLKSGTTYAIDVASLLPDGTRSSYTPRITVTTD